MADEEIDKHKELLEAIQGIKGDIYELINVRLNNFKTELLSILDSNLKMFRHELDTDINDIYKKLETHEKQLSEHDKKIKAIETNTDTLIKSLFWKLSILGVVALGVNTVIIVAVVSKFLK